MGPDQLYVTALLLLLDERLIDCPSQIIVLFADALTVILLLIVTVTTFDGLDWQEKFVELLFAFADTVILLNLVVNVMLPAGGLYEDEFAPEITDHVAPPSVDFCHM